MKQLLGFITIVLGLMACTTSKTSEQKRAEAEQTMRQIMDSLDNQTFALELNYVIPRKMTPRYLMPTYSIRVKGDSVFSYLPYFGVAYRSDMSNSYSSPLEFENKMTEYNYGYGKRGSMRVSFKTVRKLEQLIYQIEIFDNGKATLDVLSTDRESITFTGDFKMKER